MNTTEILGFAAIAGALIFILARRALTSKNEAAAEDIEFTADKLRLDIENTGKRFQREMEKSADTIIGRISDHIDRLEKVIGETDEATARLDKKIAALKAAEAERDRKNAAEKAEKEKAEQRTRAEKIAAAQQAILAASEKAAQASSAVNGGNEFSRLLDATIERGEAVSVSLAGREAPPMKIIETRAAPLKPAANPPAAPRQRIDYYARMRELKQAAPSYPEEGIEPIAALSVAAAPAVAPASYAPPTAPTYDGNMLRRPMTIEEVEAAIAANRYEYDEYVEEYSDDEPPETPAAEYLPQREAEYDAIAAEEIAAGEENPAAIYERESDLPPSGHEEDDNYFAGAERPPHGFADGESTRRDFPDGEAESRDDVSEDGWPTTPLEVADIVEAGSAIPPAAVPPMSETPTDEARRLLSAGFETAEIARRVRLGKGAIELMRQMEKKE